MARERLFLDTSFIVANLNPKDDLHYKAKELVPRVQKAEIWVTEAVLVEVGNAFSKGSINRKLAVNFIEDCLKDYLTNVVYATPKLFLLALDLYKRRPDKTSGLVDCISFVVMEEYGITAALTYDLDFVQAGFTALMRG